VSFYWIHDNIDDPSNTEERPAYNNINQFRVQVTAGAKSEGD